MTTVEAPKNALTTGFNAVLDALIKGLGVDMAYAAAVSAVPWLGLPVISTLFKWVLGYFASSLDSHLKINADIIIIRYQNDIRKEEYDKAIEPLKKPGATDAEIQAAKDALYKLVHRAK